VLSIDDSADGFDNFHGFPKKSYAM